MKKKNLTLAILAIAMATVVSVAIVSCKKDDPNTLLNSTSQSAKNFTPPQVDDMDAYLKNFKQRMQSVTRDNIESLSLEEAAWHLSNVANYDYSNANVEFTDLRYDTLYFRVNLTEGKVLMQDLNTVYSDITIGLNHLYQNLDLQNKHFRIIKASISEEGVASILVITSYTFLDHTWYLDDFWGDTVCDYYFSGDSVYVWNDLGANELERVANLIAGRNYVMSLDDLSSRVYFVYTMTQNFEFGNNIDPYGSPFLGDSRIFAVNGDAYSIPKLSMEKMCYCLDSYLGLPFEYINNNINYVNQIPVFWEIERHSNHFPHEHFYTYYHILKVNFAERIYSNNNPIQN